MPRRQTYARSEVTISPSTNQPDLGRMVTVEIPINVKSARLDNSYLDRSLSSHQPIRDGGLIESDQSEAVFSRAHVGANQSASEDYMADYHRREAAGDTYALYPGRSFYDQGAHPGSPHDITT